MCWFTEKLFTTIAWYAMWNILKSWYIKIQIRKCFTNSSFCSKIDNIFLEFELHFVNMAKGSDYNVKSVSVQFGMTTRRKWLSKKVCSDKVVWIFTVLLFMVIFISHHVMSQSSSRLEIQVGSPCYLSGNLEKPLVSISRNMCFFLWM